jgi:hypothetical protein
MNQAHDADHRGGAISLPGVAGLPGARVDADDPSALVLLVYQDLGGPGAGEWAARPTRRSAHC